MGPGSRSTVLLLLVVSAALCLPAWSQTNQARPADAAPADASPTLHIRPFSSNVDLVLVPVTVTDQYSRPVLGLRQDDFRLFEDGAPQEIRYFGADDAPLSIGIILDLSESMKDKIEVAREALSEFFKNANPEDDYFIVTFADQPHLLADVSSSIGDIQAQLATATPAGHTALLDAIYLGLERAHHARYRRRALLVISDGGDNRSRFTTRELKSLVEEEDTQIYAIGIYSALFHTPEEWAGKRLLNQITEATGGHAVTVSNPRLLPRVAAALSTEMRSQYVLGYLPPQAGGAGQYRQIKVEFVPPIRADVAQSAVGNDDDNPAPTSVNASEKQYAGPARLPSVTPAAEKTRSTRTASRETFKLRDPRYFQVHWKRGYTSSGN